THFNDREASALRRRRSKEPQQERLAGRTGGGAFVVSPSFSARRILSRAGRASSPRLRITFDGEVCMNRQRPFVIALTLIAGLARTTADLSAQQTATPVAA